MGTEPRPSPVAAVCGLYCGCCTIWIASQEDPQRLAVLAGRFGTPIEKLCCDGCRAERRTSHCHTCTLRGCAQERGLDFCFECGDYACAELRAFQSKFPHRIGLWESLAMIRDQGREAWEAYMKNQYACPSCGIINSAYDLECRACGHSPGSNFVEEHAEAIRSFLQTNSLLS